MTDPPLFALTTLALLVAPGPTNAVVAAAGALRGIRAAPAIIAAELAGYLITVCALGFLLRPLIATTPILGTILKLAAAIYLGVVAVQLWRRHDHPSRPAMAAVGTRHIFAVTLLNPKCLIFSLAVIPFDSPQISQYLLLFTVGIVATGLFWLALGTVLANYASSRRYLIPRTTSIVLAGFAGLIAATALF